MRDGRTARGDPLEGPSPGAGRPPPGAFPPRRCAATGSGSARKGSGRRWLAAPAASFTAPPRPDLAASRGRGPSARCALSPPLLPRGGRCGGTGPPAPGAAVFDRGGLSSVRPDRVASPGRGSAHEKGVRGLRRCRQPTRPVLKHGPRSLTRARVGGLVSKPRGAMKVRAGARRLRWDPGPLRGARAHHRPVSPAPSGRWSVSARDRTRKMVNYAWAGRSQRKLWWRPAAVLTCKSVVRPGYRGERLIEPSSSWFLPKSPSGQLALRVLAVLSGKAND